MKTHRATGGKLPRARPRAAPNPAHQSLTAPSSRASSLWVPLGRRGSGPLESGPQLARRAIRAQGAAPGVRRCSLWRPCGRGGDGRRREGGPRQGSAPGGGSRNVSRAREARLGRGRAGPPPSPARTSAAPDRCSAPDSAFPSLRPGPLGTPRALPCPALPAALLPTALISPDPCMSFRFHSGIPPKGKITSGGPGRRGRFVF